LESSDNLCDRVFEKCCTKSSLLYIQAHPEDPSSLLNVMMNDNPLVQTIFSVVLSLRWLLFQGYQFCRSFTILRILCGCLGAVQNGVTYVRVFVGILRDISKQETVEYMLAMVDEMLTGKAPKLFFRKP
jgi:hypothetical protein